MEFFERFGGWESMPPLLAGAWLTIILVVVTGSIGLVAGTVLGVMGNSNIKILRYPSVAFVSFIRGQPVLIILFFAYYVIPIAFSGIGVTQSTAAITGLSIYAAAYISEIIRGSLRSVDYGQIEAADSLALSPWNRLVSVLLPQALRVAMAPTIGFLIALVKATSLTSVIGYAELTRAGRILYSHNQEPIITFLIVAAMYFIISYPISLLGQWYEKKVMK